MVATTAFVLGFVVIGLAVVLVAMRAGSAGAHRDTPQAARDRTTATAAILGATVVFGVGVPAAVMAANAGSRAKEAPGGVRLTDAQQHGRELFARNCATCHTLKAANAVGRVGPNLDQRRPPKALVLNAIQLGRARGMGQMPADLLTGQDAQDVASFVAAAAGR